MEIASERKERFKTGGGPIQKPETSNTITDAVRSVLGQQMPLQGVDDDDHVDSGKVVILA